MSEWARREAGRQRINGLVDWWMGKDGDRLKGWGWMVEGWSTARLGQSVSKAGCKLDASALTGC